MLQIQNFSDVNICGLKSSLNLIFLIFTLSICTPEVMFDSEKDDFSFIGGTSVLFRIIFSQYRIYSLEVLVLDQSTSSGMTFQ